jgi:hypothetical protein
MVRRRCSQAGHAQAFEVNTVADITNPEVLRYVAEVIRPHAEKFRNLKHTVDAALQVWNDQILPNCPYDSSPIADGREAEGISRLTGADVTRVIIQLGLFQDAMNVAGVNTTISKPCVRPLDLP